MAAIDTESLEVKQIRPGWNGRFLHTENLTFAYYSLEPGASIPQHAHPEEEVWNVVSGELEISIGDETRVAGPGWVGVVPPDTPHSVRVLKACRVIIVDHPARHVVGGVDTR